VCDAIHDSPEQQIDVCMYVCDVISDPLKQYNKQLCECVRLQGYWEGRRGNSWCMCFVCVSVHVLCVCPCMRFVCVHACALCVSMRRCMLKLGHRGARKVVAFPIYHPEPPCTTMAPRIPLQNDCILDPPALTSNSHTLLSQSRKPTEVFRLGFRVRCVCVCVCARVCVCCQPCFDLLEHPPPVNLAKPSAPNTPRNPDRAPQIRDGGGHWDS